MLGERVSTAERAAWGFQNETDIVTLESGERCVLQRYRHREHARRRLAILDALAEPAAEAGIPIPRMRVADLDGEPPWAIYHALPGAPANDAREYGLSGSRFPETARLMGELLARFRTLPSAGLELDERWADPTRLAAAARGWLQRLSELDSSERLLVERILDRLPVLFGGRDAVLAHGDYAPMNVLIANGNLTGLLDLESVRLADPLFDVAWWSWAVGTSSRAILDRALPPFLEAAEIDTSDPDLSKRLRALQILRMLELLAEQQALGVREAVIHRLRSTLHDVAQGSLERGRG
jgi:aminoglycoside phosphotransferase (APT) family kinase protein